MAEVDKLTGFMTHKDFLERIEHETIRAKRYKTPLSLIMLEVNYDYFEKDYDIKSQLAYPLLRQLGILLRKTLRDVDLMARYKGDQIAILCPGTNEAGAKLLMERMRKNVEEKTFKGDENKETFRVAISAGMATYLKHSNTAQQLVASAQKALHMALAKGGNCTLECPVTLEERETTS